MTQERPYGTREAASDPAETGGERPESMREHARGIADAAMDQAAERAREMEEAGRDRLASGVDRLADGLRDRAHHDGGGMKAESMQRVAAGMERTAGYLREHDAARMRDNFEHYVREHPMTGVAAAVAAGFVIGRILR